MIRTTTHLTIALVAIATTFMLTWRDRVDTAVERSKDETGALSLEFILIAVFLVSAVLVVGGLIMAKIRSEGGKL